jgi:hypothetical protein
MPHLVVVRGDTVGRYGRPVWETRVHGLFVSGEPLIDGKTLRARTVVRARRAVLSRFRGTATPGMSTHIL